MTTARKLLVDPDVTRYYHCISRCVRRAKLCGDGFEHRKAWIENRLEVLAGAFALSVCGFAVMDNHLHVLVRLDPEDGDAWSNEEVIRRWLKVFPPAHLDMDNEELVKAHVNNELSKPGRADEYRQRLKNLGWFMKALKEPLARMANREDDCRGTFWEARYKSIGILDEEALLAVCAYIDLNPVAAGIARLPETSKHTSIRQRVLHAKKKGKLDALKTARSGSVAASRALGNLEEDHWLCPIEDRRSKGGKREGMLSTFSLGSYLLLVDYTSRLCRQGKARVDDGVKEIFERLGSSFDVWEQRMKHLLGRERLNGSYFATDREKLRELAAKRKCHHLANLAGCPG